MNSAKKMAANRRNARLSSGPKSTAGKARSAQNARRHGLNVNVFADPVHVRQIEDLIGVIAGASRDPQVRECARRVAEAQVDVVRVQQARQALVLPCLNNPRYRFLADSVALLRLGGRIIKRGRAPRKMIKQVEDRILAMRGGVPRLADVLTYEIDGLARLDRYERRALSRRKFAIRAFDVACREERRLAQSVGGAS